MVDPPKQLAMAPDQTNSQAFTLDISKAPGTHSVLFLCGMVHVSLPECKPTHQYSSGDSCVAHSLCVDLLAPLLSPLPPCLPMPPKRVSASKHARPTPTSVALSESQDAASGDSQKYKLL